MKQSELLLNRILKFRNDRNWKQFHTPKDMAISLLLEASELLECYQWNKEADQKNIERELADILYWVLLISHDLNIDVYEALLNKMIENEKKYPVDKSKNKCNKYYEL